jgi:hypothetical protein
MTRTFAALAILFYTATFASAASLFWDAPRTGNINLERADSEAGPFLFVTTISAEVPYSLTPGAFGYYRIVSGGIPSNVVRYSLDVYGHDVLAALGSIETKVDQLQVLIPAPTVNNITAKQLDANKIEITGQACTSLKTTGSGLKRIVECLH